MKNVVQFVENFGAWPGMAKAHEIGLEKAGVTVLKQVDVPTDAVTFGPLVVKPFPRIRTELFLHVMRKRLQN